MKLATIKVKDMEQAAIVADEKLILIGDINRIENRRWETNIFDILQKDQLEEINDWYKQAGKQKLEDYADVHLNEYEYTALYRQPKKIFGIGMNYLEKAREFASTPLEMEPVSFLKPDSSLIGPGESIKLPAYPTKVSAEGELAIIIGKSCRNIEESEVPNVVAGFTTSLDMTAKDIHAKNPRFLQISKIFDTFFSFGPHLMTIDEIPNLEELTVCTVLNGETIHSNRIANMMYHPWFIVSYFSKIVTLSPGDVIMTGTPGSVEVKEGDVAECNISEFTPLRNPVI